MTGLDPINRDFDAARASRRAANASREADDAVGVGRDVSGLKLHVAREVLVRLEQAVARDERAGATNASGVAGAGRRAETEASIRMIALRVADFDFWHSGGSNSRSRQVDR